MSLTFRIFVGQARAQAFHYSSRGEVLRGDELKAANLPLPLLLDQVVQHGIVLLQRLGHLEDLSISEDKD
jgi:hypothetical protein